MKNNSSASTLRARLAAARIVPFTCAARTLAPVAAIAMASACALHGPVLGPVAALPAIEPVRTGSALSPELKPARHDVTAGARNSDAQDDLEGEEDAPEEPELEQIPMVPVADPQSFAV